MSDGTVATDGSKIRAIWSLRESIAEAYRHEGVSYHVSYFYTYSPMHTVVYVLHTYVYTSTKCVGVRCDHCCVYNVPLQPPSTMSPYRWTTIMNSWNC